MTFEQRLAGSEAGHVDRRDGQPRWGAEVRAWSGPAVLEEEQEVRMAEVEPREQEGEGEEVRPTG